jgi:hypothetical protein
MCTNGACVCSTTSYYWSSYLQSCQLCPPDWTIVSYGNYQTCIKDFSVDFGLTLKYSARSYCESYEAHVVKLNDSLLNLKLKSLFLKNDLFYWLDAEYAADSIFLYPNYLTPWYTPAQLVDLNLIPWCAKQPDGGSLETYLAVSILNWCMMDITSLNNVQFYFMCQKFR